MERREFLTVAGAVAAAWPTRKAEVGTRNWEPDDSFRVPRSTFRVAPTQEPALSRDVFARRLARAQQELQARKTDLLIATPGTNYEYLTGYNPGRSERLIALLLPARGDPTIVCPSFEVERIRQHSVVAATRGWEEQDDPYRLVRQAVREMKLSARAVALESTTAYAVALRLAEALGGKFADAAPITDRLRIIKSPEEVALIRQAIDITEAAIAATFAKLAAGASEREVAQLLSGEMRQRGAEGGGLVQFGPSSALPHGGPGGPTLAREMVVLIDCGCRVAGYTSDITRTTWFGDSPVPEFTQVFNLVHDAQTAAMQQPPLTPCQEMDRVARRVIAQGGFGPFFTHRLGHGMGLDGHEPPYLVEGNATPLEPGMVFTIEPGIYQLGKFGVRIEDDCVMTERNVEVLSHRAAKL